MIPRYTHPEMGRIVLEKWKFEPVVCEAIGRQNDYERSSKRAADITDVVIAGVVLAESLLDGGGDLTRCVGVTAFERLGLGHKQLAAILKHTEYRLVSLRETLGC